MKLLYKKEYIGRTLFILEIQGKYLSVYRSSGYSGTGHEGQILPFSSLSSRQTISTCLGYIYKEMFYDGRWTSHYKIVQDFPGVLPKMDQIQEFLKDEQADPEFELDELDPLIMNKFKDYIGKIQQEMLEVTSDLDPFDLKDDL